MKRRDALKIITIGPILPSVLVPVEKPFTKKLVALMKKTMRWSSATDKIHYGPEDGLCLYVSPKVIDDMKKWQQKGIV